MYQCCQSIDECAHLGEYKSQGLDQPTAMYLVSATKSATVSCSALFVNRRGGGDVAGSNGFKALRKVFLRC